MNDRVFINDPVSETSLPAASDLKFEGLAPTYARTMIIEWVASWLLIAVVNLAIDFFTPLELWALRKSWVIVPYLGMLLSVIAWAPMVARSRGFALRDNDIHYKSGLIWRKTVSLPFNRIQHIELESGPLERLFKLTTLKFFTAGGGSADMKIPALTFASATNLRTFVMEQAGVDQPLVGQNSETGANTVVDAE